MKVLINNVSHGRLNCFSFLFHRSDIKSITIQSIPFNSINIRYIKKLSKIIPGAFSLNKAETLEWFNTAKLEKSQLYCVFCCLRYLYSNQEIVKNFVRLRNKPAIAFVIAHVMSRVIGIGVFNYRFTNRKFMYDCITTPFDIKLVDKKYRYLNQQFIYSIVREDFVYKNKAQFIKHFKLEKKLWM